MRNVKISDNSFWRETRSNLTVNKGYSSCCKTSWLPGCWLAMENYLEITSSKCPVPGELQLGMLVWCRTNSKEEHYPFAVDVFSVKALRNEIVSYFSIVTKPGSSGLLFFYLFMVIRVMPGDVKSLLQSWQGERVDKRWKMLWKSAHLCILWMVWLERKKRCFEGKIDHTSFVRPICLRNLYLWCKFHMIDSKQFMGPVIRSNLPFPCFIVLFLYLLGTDF